ncbi:MAG: site-specific integrase [Phycisphaeraceae bacterium]|nr:MAG: site-specific integrase [Phycisphaeraceae bacterium]
MSGKERRKSTHKQLEKGSKEGGLRARTCDPLAPKAQVAGSTRAGDRGPRSGAPKATSRGSSKTPAYRARPEYGQAIVTLTDKTSGARRDYWLGEVGSPESRERYYRTLAAWESRGRTLPTFEECGLVPTFHAMKRRRAELNATGGGTRGTIAAALLLHWREVKDTVSSKRANAIKVTLRLLREMDGSTAMKDYGPNRLRLLRERMRSGDADSDPPREPWSRRTTNERVRIVQAFFRWAVAREMVHESVARALEMVDPLKRRRGEADDRKKVLPVTQDLIDATLPHCSRQVRALIELQLLTGARPGELVGLRAIDIRTDGGDGGEGVWVFEPQDHKNAHRGHTRVILFGPRAQEILRPFMSSRPVDAPLFSPREAEEERRRAAHEARRTPKGYGNGPGTNRSRAPRRPPGDAYDVGSYRRAIWRACDAAFPLPKELRKKRFETAEAWRERVGDEGAAAAARWRGEHRWNPHQLRHTAATRIRKEHGLEAASLILGHASAVVTDAIYAERDLGTAARVARAYG